MEQERIRGVYPSESYLKRSLLWLRAYNLGGKRILDTQMAATYAEVGVSILWTADQKGFAQFGVFQIPEY